MVRSRRTPPRDGLAEECTAFLIGRYADLLSTDGMPVPVWAWLNLLAHGTQDELRRAACDLATCDGWAQARAFMAGEVCDAIDSGPAILDQLQRHVLVPLELEVAACPSASRWSSPQLVGRLVSELPESSSRTGRGAG